MLLQITRNTICEYIWNGFDAAIRINIDFFANELGGIESLEIRDNGERVNRSMHHQTFGRFIDSIKKKSQFH